MPLINGIICECKSKSMSVFSSVSMPQNLHPKLKIAPHTATSYIHQKKACSQAIKVNKHQEEKSK